MGAGFARYGFASTCFLANSSGKSDGSKAFAAANGRAVPSTTGPADQHAAPAGQAGGADRLGADRAYVRGLIHVRPRAARLAGASGRRAAVPAAHLRCLRRGGGQHVGGEPVLAVLVARPTCRPDCPSIHPA